MAHAGPLFAVLLGAAALGASLVFSTAAFFILVPLTVATLAVTFGLSAGAFVIKGIVFSVFNLVSLPPTCPVCTLMEIIGHTSGCFCPEGILISVRNLVRHRPLALWEGQLQAASKSAAADMSHSLASGQLS